MVVGAVNVSPLIRGGRWIALISGIVYGKNHLAYVKERRQADVAAQKIHAEEAAAVLEAKKAAEANAPSILG